MSFFYDLPAEQIAQRPVSGARSNSRLLHVGENLRDYHVYNLPQLLKAGDLLVLNNTRVIACRFVLPGEIKEIFLLGKEETGDFRALVRPFRKASQGLVLQLSDSILGRITGVHKEDGEISIALSSSTGNLDEEIEKEGLIPIPPYIRDGISDAEDRKSYQTVFAQNSGSIAAPTAALHFTEELFSDLASQGIEKTFLTLHVGAASILPIERQKGGVAEEKFVIPEESFLRIREAKEQGRRVVAVGTTVTRALESLSEKEWRGDYDFKPRATSLFIQPGFNFKIVSALMTNFHQSGSTHLSLVAAFAGTERMQNAYSHALANGYRFLSYGDSSLLERE